MRKKNWKSFSFLHLICGLFQLSHTTKEADSVFFGGITYITCIKISPPGWIINDLTKQSTMSYFSNSKLFQEEQDISTPRVGCSSCTVRMSHTDFHEEEVSGQPFTGFWVMCSSVKKDMFTCTLSSQSPKRWEFRHGNSGYFTGTVSTLLFPEHKRILAYNL